MEASRMTSFIERNKGIIEEYRANGGRMTGRWEGRPLLLLTTTGAKTGQLRTSPVTYLEGDGRYYVFASKGGSETHPDWYRNLVADPAVSVEMGEEKFEATATVLPGAERDAIYEKQTVVMPQFGEYQSGISRTIPVIALTRIK
jgi:deazaflavin-dependent oxidoreductase (nitroreductase family)